MVWADIVGEASLGEAGDERRMIVWVTIPPKIYREWRKLCLKRGVNPNDRLVELIKYDIEQLNPSL